MSFSDAVERREFWSFLCFDCSNGNVAVDQVIITTYQTLNLDLIIKDDIDDGGEMEYLLNHG